MQFFSRISGVLKNPEEYFSKVKKEGFWEPFWFYLIWALVTTIFPSIYLLKSMEISLYWLPLAYPLYLLFTLASLLIGVGVVHFFLTLLGGQGKFADTLKAVAYGAIPSLLWAIPARVLQILFLNNIWGMILLSLPGFGFAIYALYLEVVGASVLHKLSRGRALLGILLPSIILVGVILIIVILVVVLIAAGLIAASGGI